jgi:hypothetical protein
MPAATVQGRKARTNFWKFSPRSFLAGLERKHQPSLSTAILVSLGKINYIALKTF